MRNPWPQTVLWSNSDKKKLHGIGTDTGRKINGVEDPEMNSHTYGHLDCFSSPVEKNSILNKWFWFNWQSACRKMQINPFLSLCKKLNSKWIKNLHVKPDTVTLTEEKTGKSLKDMGTGENFLNSTLILKLNFNLTLHKCFYYMFLKRLECLCLYFYVCECTCNFLSNHFK